jgi:hypothetical protein
MNLWIEGYSATGESASATYLGNYPGDTLKEAIANFSRSTGEQIDEDGLSIWGCRIFDNEDDARRSFG